MTSDTHCGHPKTGFVTSSEGTSYCPECERLTPERIAGLARLLAEASPERVTIDGFVGSQPVNLSLALAAVNALPALLAEREGLREALRETIPYVNGAIHSDQPWRVETATGVLCRIRAALAEGAPDG